MFLCFEWQFEVAFFWIVNSFLKIFLKRGFNENKFKRDNFVQIFVRWLREMTK